MSTTVYRMFDADGTLLYVGCTGQLPVRLDQHGREQPWWDDVATVAVTHFATRQEALRAEREAIDGEQPRYNADLSQVTRESWQTRRKADSTYDILNQFQFDGEFRSVLASWLSEGMSPTDIARRLRDFRVKTSPTTVRRWLIRDGLLTVKERAS